MFQSEQLQEKWAPLLDYEGMDPIKDNHRKAVTAVLLENQEKFLREQSAFENGTTMLTEQPTNNTGTNSATGAGAGNAGFSGNATATGPVAGFDPVLISLIRRAMPNLVAYDLAGVQPMSGPTGLIFAMRSRYKNMNGDETFYDEVNSAFSGQNSNEDITSGASDIATGMGTTTQGGTNPAVLNPQSAANSRLYTVGQGMRTDHAEKLGNATNNANTNALFKAVADDGEAADLYVGKFHNLEATAGQSYGIDIRAGSNSTDHGFRVKNKANDATHLLVRGDGRIGVNTASPTDKLHVTGDVEFTLGTELFDVMTTGSGTKYPIRLLNADASANNEVGIQFGPANNVAGAGGHGDAVGAAGAGAGAAGHGAAGAGAGEEAEREPGDQGPDGGR